MVRFGVERMVSVEGEIRGLLKGHWEEVALDKGAIALNPDWASYRTLDEQGTLHITTVRDDGVLVGYYVSVVKAHLHYADSLTSFPDIFYLQPPYRGLCGIKLFKAHEKFMRERGVQKIYVTHKLHVNGHIGAILGRLGYRHIENVYAKVLEA